MRLRAITLQQNSKNSVFQELLTSQDGNENENILGKLPFFNEQFEQHPVYATVKYLKALGHFPKGTLFFN